MDEELYALTVRALIHSSTGKADCKSYQVVEQLKQQINFDDQIHHQILSENENCIEYSLEVQVIGNQNQRFLLQISRNDDGMCAMQEAMISAKETSTLPLRHGKCSLIRVFMGETEERAHNQKSTSFLKRWCRLNGRANVLLTVKVKHFVVGQSSEFPLNKATLVFTLKQNQISGRELKTLEFEGLKKLIWNLYTLVYESKTSWDFAFDVLKNVTVFYDFPTSTWKLLLIGIILSSSCDERTIEDVAFVVQRNFQALRSATLVQSPHVVEAAIFLSTQLLSFTDDYIRESPEDVFFPVNSPHQNNEAFHMLMHHLSPILDVAHLSLWDHEKVYGLSTKLSVIFAKKLQCAVGEYLHNQLSVPVVSSEVLCNLVDELHVALRECTTLCQDFFQRLWLSYLKTVVEIVDDPLCHLCQQTLLVEMESLCQNSHNENELLTFSKNSMKLFDALRQFVQFIVSQGQVSRLQKFEVWFEKPAIFWTSSWRVLYLGFIKKSVDSAENGEHTFCDLSEDLDLKKCDVELHEATVNCLAFCKALCDDFIRLQIQNSDILLICALQSIPILTDCLNSFAIQIYHQLKQNPTVCNMLKTANGIEHASNHLMTNFERFLHLSTIVSRFEPDERKQVVGAIRRVMVSSEKRCKQLSTEIVTNICKLNFSALRKHCTQVTNPNEHSKRKLRSYVSQVFTSDGSDQLLIFLDKLCINFKYTLLPRLHSVAMNCLWVEVRNAFTDHLAKGQPAEYYEQVNKTCEIVCRTIGINWNKDCEGPLRHTLHLNRASTKELILQYYSKLCDMTSSTRPTTGTPRVHLRVGYIQTTNRQILLNIYALCAYDIPVLDMLTKSSDPYLRIELYPRCFFPLSQYPAQTTETRKQTLQPKWNEAFQISVPEEYFFMNGVCLCLTVLDHDIVSYNDLAGQGLLPLASVPKLKSLSAKDLPKPIVVPLILPTPTQYDEHFQVLEKRSNKDKVAREVVAYEKYLRSYRMLPEAAEDDKEYRFGAVGNRKKIKRLLTQLTQKFI